MYLWKIKNLTRGTFVVRENRLRTVVVAKKRHILLVLSRLRSPSLSRRMFDTGSWAAWERQLALPCDCILANCARWNEGHLEKHQFHFFSLLLLSHSPFFAMFAVVAMAMAMVTSLCRPSFHMSHSLCGNWTLPPLSSFYSVSVCDFCLSHAECSIVYSLMGGMQVQIAQWIGGEGILSTQLLPLLEGLIFAHFPLSPHLTVCLLNDHRHSLVYLTLSSRTCSTFHLSRHTLHIICFCNSLPVLLFNERRRGGDEHQLNLLICFWLG